MPFYNAKKNRVLKWIFGTILLLAILIGLSSWYISHQIKPYLKQEIKSLVQKSTRGLYHVDFSAINTNLITGSATIVDVKITPDTNVYHQQVLAQKAPDNLYYIKLKQITIQHFKPLNIYFNKRIAIKMLLFDKPEVKMVNKHYDFNENRPPRPLQSPYEVIKKLFSSISIDFIEFKNAHFKYVNNNGLVPEIDSVANLNVSLRDWLIDSLSAQDTTRLYLLKDINVRVNDYTYATPDSMYHIKVDQLSFNAASGKVNVKKFGLIPRYSQAQFAKVKGFAIDRFNIELNDINLDGLSLPAYLKKRELIAKSMRIADGFVEVFNDNSLPSVVKVKTGKYPHQLLQQLNTNVTINDIFLQNIDVSYAEFDEQTQQTGKITFLNTTGKITNATNAPKFKNINSIMNVALNSEVMGQGKLKVVFDFDLNASNGAFSYQGELTNLEGKKLNQITKPLGMIQVNSGLIKSLVFDVKADDHLAKGKLDFTYNDLSVGLLKKEAGRERLVKKGLLSILANALIIYSDNPNNAGKFTSATVNYKREPTASFFNFIWKSLFQGVKYSVGISPAKEAEIKSQVNRFEQMKEDRDERRWRRQQRNNIRNK